MIDTKGKTYNYDALTFDVDDEDEVDYETQRKEEGLSLPCGCFWSDDSGDDDIICGAKLLQSDDDVLFETDQFCSIEEIGAGFYQASLVERQYNNDVKVILKNDVTPGLWRKRLSANRRLQRRLVLLRKGCQWRYGQRAPSYENRERLL